MVIHAGDFITGTVLDAFEARAADLQAVHGNVDDSEVQARLPRARTIQLEGRTIALIHTVRGGDTELSMFGRECGADLVIHGHSHKPRYQWTGELGLLNPGSHAQPRGNRPGYAELELEEDRLVGTIREPGGNVIQRFEIR